MSTIKAKYLATINPKIYLKAFPPNMAVSFAPMECVKKGYMMPKEATIDSWNTSYNCFNNDDILMAKVTPCFENGNIAIASNLVNGVGYGSSELFVFRASKCEVKYLFYLLQEETFKQFAISTMTGAGGLKRVSLEAIKNYNVLKINLDLKLQ